MLPQGGGTGQTSLKGSGERFCILAQICFWGTHIRGASKMCAGKSKSAGRVPPSRASFVLRQVIAERREDHVVDSVWSRGDTLTTRCPRPSVAGNIGVLCSPLHAALFSVVEAIPESHRAFDNDPGIACAVGQGARNKPDRPEDCRRIGRVAWSSYGQRFNRTPIISECGGSVSRCASFPGNQVGKAVGSAAGVFPASVKVDIQLRRGVQFECAQCLIISQQCESAVRANG